MYDRKSAIFYFKIIEFQLNQTLKSHKPLLSGLFNNFHPRVSYVIFPDSISDFICPHEARWFWIWISKQARKPRSCATSKLQPSHRPTNWLSGVECRAASVAKNHGYQKIKNTNIKYGYLSFRIQHMRVSCLSKTSVEIFWHLNESAFVSMFQSAFVPMLYNNFLSVP